MADAFGQAATHAPQPMQAAALNALLASSCGTGSDAASGADPVGALTYQPAAIIRPDAGRSATKSLITGNAVFPAHSARSNA